MLHCKPTLFPLFRGLYLSPNIDKPLTETDCYRKVIGRLLYINLTRLDISYVVQHLSKFITTLERPYYEVAMHVV